MGFWLPDAGEGRPRPPLPRSVEADVAILGAGFTGLWTAWYLKRRDPAMRVVLCEANVAGWGASGRNGGWCVGALGVSPGELARRHGADAARRTVREIRATVDRIGRLCAAEGVDAEFRKGGVLRVARGSHEVPLARRGYEELVALDLAERVELLDAPALAARVRVAGGQGALYDPNAATIHPGRLVRGLAQLVEDAGARLYEGTPVTAVVDGRSPCLRTPAGDVRAGTVVLAGESYLTRLPGWRRRLLPVYSLIVLTEPLEESVWEQIGWRGNECLSSHRYSVDYAARTADGRILFGGRGAPYHFGSSVAPGHDEHGRTHAGLRAALREWFPVLAGVAFTHAWGGPVALSRDFSPSVFHDRGRGLAWACGYGGQGVAATNLAGRMLADMITATDSPLLGLPIAGHVPRPWEPEPLRWLGVRAMQLALRAIDARAARSGRPPSGRSLPERLIRH